MPVPADPRGLFDLTNRVALITGAAGGLGSALARGLAGAGAAVALVDLEAGAVERLAEELRASFDRPAFAAALDVTRKPDVDALVDRVIAELGQIDILINCAGITRRAPAEEFPEEHFDRIMAVNVKGTLLACQAVARHLIACGAPGSIVNLASVAGLAGLRESVAYCASKGAVVQITRTMALEWAERGIRVNALAPSWFDTQMGALSGQIDRIYAEGVRKPTPEWLTGQTVGRVPIGRLGRPDELVGATLFLASAASSMVTGHILAVDGGFLAE